MKLTKQGPALTPNDFTALEQEMGAQVPNDYKLFLLASNGGIPEPPIGFKWKGEMQEVGVFWLLLPTPDHGLRLALRRLRELNVDGFLSIAGVWDRDVCLDFRGSKSAVTFAHYTYRDDFVEVVTMHELANSFCTFLDSLVEIPLIYCRIEDLGKRGTPQDLAEYLLEGDSLNAVGKNGLTILCEAIKFKNLPLVEACIKSNASLSQAIVAAVRSRSPNLIRQLVDAGADVNEKNAVGCTPIFYVGGIELSGGEGALNRKLRDTLIQLGAHE